MKRISANIIVNRERGGHNLLRATIAWLIKTREYVGEENMPEAIIACSKSEFVRTKVMIKPLINMGMDCKVIPKSNEDVDRAETRNELMRYSNHQLILSLDPTILIGNTIKGYLKRAVEGKILKKINDVLYTDQMKIGMFNTAEHAASQHMLSTSKVVVYEEPLRYQLLTRLPVLFHNIQPTLLWTNYIPPIFKNATYPERLTPEKKKEAVLHRQMLVLTTDDDFNSHVCSLSIDFSRTASLYFYLEDYIASHTTIEPYFKVYKKRGTYKDAYLTLRYPNPYEIKFLIKTLFYGSDSFMHYTNYRLRYYLPNLYNTIMTEVGRRPRLYQYAQDEGLYVFPYDGENSLFAKLDPIYDLINPKE